MTRCPCGRHGLRFVCHVTICALAARPAPVDRRRPGASPFEGPDVRAVDRRVVHLQQARRPQFSQKHFMQTGLDPGFRTPERLGILMVQENGVGLLRFDGHRGSGALASEG